AGVTVIFTAPAEGPSGTFFTAAAGVPTAEVQTNALGIATAPQFIADEVAGSFSVIATVAGVAGISAAFDLTNISTAPAAVISAVGGNSQSAPIVIAYGTPLQALVTDPYEFVFGAGANLTGPIHGGEGGDWLDSSASTTPVTVNLAAGTATG